MQTGTWLILPQYSLWSDRFWNSDYAHAYPPQEGLINREEKSLRRVAMVAKFLANRKFALKVNSHCFKLHWSYSFSFNLSNVGKIIWIKPERTVSEGFLFPRTKQTVGIMRCPYKVLWFRENVRAFYPQGQIELSVMIRNNEVSILSGVDSEKM